MQTYHSNATTNLNIRQLIKNSNATNFELAQQFNISKQTVSKWKNRDSLDDKSSKPNSIRSSLTDLETALVISLRQSTWMSLDNVWEALLSKNENISRISIYRAFKKHDIHVVPQEQREKAKKFKAYEPGYLHADVTYLPKINGQKYYLFVAIDRCTRLLFYWIYDAKTATNAENFMNKCIDFFPFKITHVLTDNGLEFTNKLLISKKGETCQKPSKLDKVCDENNIEHRLTKPATPKTNGMVERANGIIKTNTILRNKYENVSQLRQDFAMFFSYYNLHRRHTSLRKELNVKTPIQAIEKWFELKPEIFKTNPQIFKQSIIDLQNNFHHLHLQPCET